MCVREKGKEFVYQSVTFCSGDGAACMQFVPSIYATTWGGGWSRRYARALVSVS